MEEVLHYMWDPIGVAGVPEARDEYDSYATHVFSLLIREAPSHEIADYLLATETEAMGLALSEASRQRASDVTEALRRWHHIIRGRTPAI